MKTPGLRSVNDLNMEIKDFEHSTFEIEKENRLPKYEIELKDNEVGNLKLGLVNLKLLIMLIYDIIELI